MPATPAVSAKSRRQFLAKSGKGAAAAAAALLGVQRAEADTLPPGFPPGVPEWTRKLGDPTAAPYGKPSRFETRAVRQMYPGLVEPFSAYSTSPLQELDGIITPNGLFYERHHAGIPQIDPAQHRLMVHGMTQKDMLFTVDELRQFPCESKIYFMECSGNPSFLPPWGKTAAQVAGLVSCGQWTGVPLRTVLEYVGLKPGAKWVVAEGADGAGMTRSLPMQKCLDDVLLVFSQNGERLRPEQGYPLRLFAPGFEGNTCVKWLRRLHVTDRPVHAREETGKYTDLMADGRARQFSFIMECKSIITSPSGTHTLTRRGLHEMRGIAWSGRGKIAHVDVSTDGGRNWREARLDAPVLDKAMVSFRAPFEWQGAELMLMSRAVDETGYVQPTLAQLTAKRGRVSFYHNNSIQPWRVARTGEVTNGREA